VNPFWIAGGVTALWAVVLTFALGLRNHDFPRTDGQMRAVIGISAVLVVLAVASGVIASIEGLGEGKGVRHGPEPAGQGHAQE
jgi:hypothetical protein